MSETKTLCAEMVWKIENYSYIKQWYIWRLLSPEVCVKNLWGSSWCLELFENSNRGDLCLKLRRNEDTSPMKEIDVEFECAILDAERFPLADTIKYGSGAFRNYTDSGGIYLIPTELLYEKKETYLPRDILTVRVKIWRHVKTLAGASQFFFSSHLPARECVFSWWVSSDSNADSKISITIPGVVDETTLVTLKLVNRNNKMHVEVVIDGYLEEKCKLKCDIRVLTTQKMFLHFSDKIFARELPYIQEFEAQKTFDGDNLSNESEEELICTFVFIPYELKHNVARTVSDCDKGKETNLELEDSLKTQNKIEKKYCSLQHDIRILYSDSRLSDFTIKAQDKSFAVHSLILQIRSPVLSRMFQTNMKESIDKTLELDDLDEDTVRAMLDYLYTDDIGELSVESALKLYYAGDKYEIQGLKKTTSSFLESNMNILNVCDILELADRHNDEQLLSTVLNFIVRHEEKVMTSEKFINHSERNPALYMKSTLRLTKIKFS